MHQMQNKVVKEFFTCMSCGIKFSKSCFLQSQKRGYSQIPKSSRKSEIRKKLNALDNLPKAERVYVWGCASTGALGISSYLRHKEKKQKYLAQMSRPARLRFLLENNLVARSLDCGYGFTVFILQGPDGKRKLYGCGINTDSQLGYHKGTTKADRVLDYIIEPVLIPLPLECPQSTEVVDVSCGRAHTLVLTDKEGVFSLGHNAYGQCGRKIVEGEIYKGSQVVNKVTDLPSDIVKVVCGQDHSFFLTSSGQVYSCGLGADGQTGLQHYHCEWRPSLVGGDIAGERIVQLASKADCVLAVSERGDLFGWGNSEYGQLSMITEETQVSVPRHIPLHHPVTKAAAAGSKCAVLTDNNEVLVWGFGSLGLGPNVQSSSTPQAIPPTLFGRNELAPEKLVVDVTCGINHFAARTNDYEMFVWGKNQKGCLGIYIAERMDQTYPFRVSVPAEILRVFCGVDHTVAMCRAFS
ncbi:RCC1-like G exchanging factor-like protein [Saccostrea cucullata]|uniref:RCC1-like G exchanging factor-like protein n=1 Tax=Saccostrea cuccullata TaxID=36930 RepID=UPI002ECFEC4E